MSESPKGTRLPKKPTTRLQPFLSTAKGIRAFMLGAILSTPLAACGDDDPDGTTTGISSGGSTSNTTNGPDYSSSSGEVDTGEGATMGEDTMETEGEMDTGDGNTDSTTSDTTEDGTETTSQSTDTGATGVDTESYDPPSPPTVDDMPQGDNVMPIVPNVIVTGGCEPVEEVQWSYVLVDDEANWDWEDDANWKNVTKHDKGDTTWELTPDLPKIGTYWTCFRTLNHDLNSPNKAVCFKMERGV